MTKNHPIIALFLIYSIVVNSQNLYGVFDSETKLPIQFCALSFKNYNDGIYTSKDGRFMLPDYLNSNDTIYISHLAYNTSIISKNTLKDSVFLNLKIQELKEVIVKNTKPKRFLFGYNKGGNLSRALDRNQELAILMLPKKNCDNCLLDKLTIPIKKYSYKEIDGKLKKIEPKFISVIKLLIYSVKDNLPYEIVLQKPIFIEVSQNSLDEIIIDLSDEFIKLTENGLFISLSKIENSNQEFNFLPLLRYTKNKSKTVNTVSYYRNVFGNNNWESINKLYAKGDINKEYNLALKLDVLKY
ncbi:hypothetical protein [Yeosuana sp. AK3]